MQDPNSTAYFEFSYCQLNYLQGLTFHNNSIKWLNYYEFSFNCMKLNIKFIIKYNRHFEF